MPISRINSLVAECPDCSCEVRFEVMPRVGQGVVCSECGTKLEVAYLYPLMLDWVYEDDPAYDSDDDDDEFADYDGYED
jgi:lysine biosynthesis protein LysW